MRAIRRLLAFCSIAIAVLLCSVVRISALADADPTQGSASTAILDHAVPMGISLIRVMISVNPTSLCVVVSPRIRQNALSIWLSAQVDLALELTAAVVACAVLRKFTLIQAVLARATGYTSRLALLLEADSVLISLIGVGAGGSCHIIWRLLVVLLTWLANFLTHTAFVYYLDLLMLLVIGYTVKFAVHNVLLAPGSVLLELLFAVGCHPLLWLLLLVLKQVRGLVFWYSIVIGWRPLLRICNDDFLSRFIDTLVADTTAHRHWHIELAVRIALTLGWGNRFNLGASALLVLSLSVLLLVNTIHSLRFVAWSDFRPGVEPVQLPVGGLVHLVVDGAVARRSDRLRLMVARLLELLFELGSLAGLLTW